MAQFTGGFLTLGHPLNVSAPISAKEPAAPNSDSITVDVADVESYEPSTTSQILQTSAGDRSAAVALANVGRSHSTSSTESNIVDMYQNGNHTFLRLGH